MRMTKAERSRLAFELGKKGRLALKKKRKQMTPEQRSEVARKAARARWNKEKGLQPDGGTGVAPERITRPEISAQSA